MRAQVAQHAPLVSCLSLVPDAAAWQPPETVQAGVEMFVLQARHMLMVMLLLCNDISAGATLQVGC